MTERDLPDEFRQTMKASQVVFTMTTRLSALPSERTKCVWDQKYEFKNQSQKHAENFKQFAEEEGTKSE